MFSIQKKTSKIEYKLIKSQRKTISIAVDREGIVVVKAPSRLSDRTVSEIVLKKSNWILEKQIELKDINAKRVVKQYINGEKFVYLGLIYTLILIEEITKKPVVFISEDKLIVKTPTTDQETIKKAIIKWYRDMAKDKLLERVTYYEEFITERPHSIIVKEQQKRWGSCNQEGILRFNWKIIMAPINIIDYLVVHEMCHLRHMNHSKEYWNMVESILIDYKTRKEWLKKNGITLEL